MRVRSVSAVLLLSITAYLAGAAPPESRAVKSPPNSSSSRFSKSSSAEVEAVAAGPMTARIDFGVTTDDFGAVASCASLSWVNTQYVFTQSIVFGAAVEFPGGPTGGVVTVTDGACSPACRSAGTPPPFFTDWWCQFRAGSAPGVPGGLGGVNSFSAELCLIDEPTDVDSLMVAYDVDGNVIDVADPIDQEGVQALTVQDPLQGNRISFVRVTSSVDLAGLSVDLLSYDDPEPIATSVETVPSWRDYLGDSYPNPCRGFATIDFRVESRTRVHLGVYDVTGQLVRTLVDEENWDHGFGRSAFWDGRDDEGKTVSSGVYFYRLVAGEFSQTRKMVLIR